LYLDKIKDIAKIYKRYTKSIPFLYQVYELHIYLLIKLCLKKAIVQNLRLWKLLTAYIWGVLLLKVFTPLAMTT